MESVVYQVSTHLDRWAANLALGPLAWQLRPEKESTFSAQFGEFLEKFDQQSVSFGAGRFCQVGREMASELVVSGCLGFYEPGPKEIVTAQT